MATAPAFDGTQPCLKINPEIFFPEPPSTTSIEKAALYEKDVKTAKAICNTCLFIKPCLEFALKTPDTWGIWGATDERDRRRIKKQVSRTKFLDKQKGTP